MLDRYKVALDEAYSTLLKLEREERINLADTALNTPRARNYDFDTHDTDIDEEIIGNYDSDSIVGSLNYHNFIII